MDTPGAEVPTDAAGYLDVGDGNSVYWEASGTPNGIPAVALHGGPGSGCSPGMRSLFDPSMFRFVMVDQRGCGRSRPHAGDLTAPLTENTTPHLTADLERLRGHLGIERWLVWGTSWGSTLALAYAQRHPDRVLGMVLTAVTTTRPSETDWLYRGVGRFLPEQWRRFRDHVPPGGHDDLVAAYGRLLESGDPTVAGAAAQAWCDWEEAVAATDPGSSPHPRYADPAFRLAFARLCAHYFAHRAWLDDGELISRAPTLAGIPGVLVHGRVDLGSPLITAWELSRAWRDSELVVVDGAGHGGPGLRAATVDALRRVAVRGRTQARATS